MKPRLSAKAVYALLTLAKSSVNDIAVIAEVDRSAVSRAVIGNRNGPKSQLIKGVILGKLNKKESEVFGSAATKVSKKAA